MNMSANILREIVASVLKVDSRSIILSGIAPLNTQVRNWSGNQYDSRYCRDTVYEFTPNKGLIKLHTPEEPDYGNDNCAITLGEMISPEALFIVIIHDACHQMQRPEDRDYDYSITLYKSEGVNEYLNSIEETEIARWEQWLNE